MGQLLRQARYVVLTTTNLPDAVTLLTATRPRLVVIGATLDALRRTEVGRRFNSLANALTVIELPPGFSSQDAATAGRDLLDRVQATMAAM